MKCSGIQKTIPTCCYQQFGMVFFYATTPPSAWTRNACRRAWETDARIVFLNRHSNANPGFIPKGIFLIGYIYFLWIKNLCTVFVIFFVLFPTAWVVFLYFLLSSIKENGAIFNSLVFCINHINKFTMLFPPRYLNFSTVNLLHSANHPERILFFYSFLYSYEYIFYFLYIYAFYRFFRRCNYRHFSSLAKKLFIFREIFTLHLLFSWCTIRKEPISCH